MAKFYMLLYFEPFDFNRNLIWKRYNVEKEIELWNVKSFFYIKVSSKHVEELS